MPYFLRYFLRSAKYTANICDIFYAVNAKNLRTLLQKYTRCKKYAHFFAQIIAVVIFFPSFFYNICFGNFCAPQKNIANICGSYIFLPYFLRYFLRSTKNIANICGSYNFFGLFCDIFSGTFCALQKIAQIFAVIFALRKKYCKYLR